MNHAQCCCPECTAARHEMVRRTHPLHNHRDEPPKECLLPPSQMLAMRLEQREVVATRILEDTTLLGLIDASIAALRDEVAA